MAKASSVIGRSSSGNVASNSVINKLFQSALGDQVSADVERSLGAQDPLAGATNIQEAEQAALELERAKGVRVDPTVSPQERIESVEAQGVQRLGSIRDMVVDVGKRRVEGETTEAVDDLTGFESIGDVAPVVSLASNVSDGPLDAYEDLAANDGDQDVFTNIINPNWDPNAYAPLRAGLDWGGLDYEQRPGVTEVENFPIETQSQIAGYITNPPTGEDTASQLLSPMESIVGHLNFEPTAQGFNAFRQVAGLALLSEVNQHNDTSTTIIKADDKPDAIANKEARIEELGKFNLSPGQKAAKVFPWDSNKKKRNLGKKAWDIKFPDGRPYPSDAVLDSIGLVVEDVVYQDMLGSGEFEGIKDSNGKDTGLRMPTLKTINTARGVRTGVDELTGNKVVLPSTVPVTKDELGVITGQQSVGRAKSVGQKGKATADKEGLQTKIGSVPTMYDESAVRVNNKIASEEGKRLMPNAYKNVKFSKGGEESRNHEDVTAVMTVQRPEGFGSVFKQWFQEVVVNVTGRVDSIARGQADNNTEARALVAPVAKDNYATEQDRYAYKIFAYSNLGGSFIDYDHAVDMMNNGWTLKKTDPSTGFEATLDVTPDVLDKFGETLVEWETTGKANPEVLKQIDTFFQDGSKGEPGIARRALVDYHLNKAALDSGKPFQSRITTEIDSIANGTLLTAIAMGALTSKVNGKFLVGELLGVVTDPESQVRNGNLLSDMYYQSRDAFLANYDTIDKAAKLTKTDPSNWTPAIHKQFLSAFDRNWGKPVTMTLIYNKGKHAQATTLAEKLGETDGAYKSALDALVQAGIPVDADARYEVLYSIGKNMFEATKNSMFFAVRYNKIVKAASLGAAVSGFLPTWTSMNGDEINFAERSSATKGGAVPKAVGKTKGRHTESLDTAGQAWAYLEDFLSLTSLTVFVNDSSHLTNAVNNTMKADGSIWGSVTHDAMTVTPKNALKFIEEYHNSVVKSANGYDPIQMMLDATLEVRQKSLNYLKGLGDTAMSSDQLNDRFQILPIHVIGHMMDGKITKGSLKLPAFITKGSKTALSASDLVRQFTKVWESDPKTRGREYKGYDFVRYTLEQMKNREISVAPFTQEYSYAGGDKAFREANKAIAEGKTSENFMKPDDVRRMLESFYKAEGTFKFLKDEQSAVAKDRIESNKALGRAHDSGWLRNMGPG